MALLLPSSTSTAPASASSIAINKPSGVVDGDLMVAIIANDSSTNDINSVPSGWTLIRSTNGGGGGLNMTMRSYYKVASSEGSTYTWGLSGSAVVGGGIARITGADVSTQIDTSNGDGNTGASSSLSFSETVTPSITNELILFPTFVRAVGTPPTNISGRAIATDNPTWTELYDDAGASTFLNSLAYALRPQTTASGNASCTVDQSVNQWVSQLIVVKRAVALSSTITDTTTITDVLTTTAVFNKTVTDTVTPSDSINALKARGYSNTSKTSSTYSNTQKS